ncbi:uroporphyrinogen-III synthase [Paracoccus liaowanqingii]|uniref:Uroporphyrinogen-III synthase n=1 Tax=Paracoccus liaowanqingii TaxID=2560053 RepID=A0A4P7HI56_9RHOB|nr:uroporphyrinogen-III synthase [Paracoccus liaowanqingii]QBX33746.1 uroporphyrinogen-III synthase [Paracoccus liaowanqingii]
MPPDCRPPLLLTRPLSDSQRFAARMDGWPAVTSPILRIVAVDHDAAALHAAAGLVFTSAHAVGAAGPGRGRPALCVGGRTARLARAAGFAVTEGPGTAAGLVPLIAASPVPLIHPHGRHLAHPLPVPGVVVYDQQPLPLTPQAHLLLAGPAPVIVPVFSPRSARLLGDMLPQPCAPLWRVAISAAAAAAWTGPAPARCTEAAQPSAAAMQAAITQIILAEQS